MKAYLLAPWEMDRFRHSHEGKQEIHLIEEYYSPEKIE